ncbi:hypothetical protein JCGZ_21499 [Jatropha curcas]|uniref:Uncharacterized protein n=1 Tax=Jatropha curcas TaxID=180498 RepID=A0A067JE38_JATCU|nr:hypothetical protein JCGZ_21499 [Jatropha curcas]
MPTQSISLSSPTLLLSPRSSFLSSKTTIFTFPKLPLTHFRNPFPVLFCASPKSTQRQQQEEEILQLIAESNEKTLPCVRTFENDLARLSLVGGVGFEQALTAAAADGGQAAAEHINSGISAMVVETVFPGPGDEHATISTRLFLPAKKVKEKAGRLKKSYAKDILSGTTSQNILAMTFRQVVLQKLWNFELVVFRPGTERNIEDLENPREVPASFFISSSDEQVISVLAEAVCVAALQHTEKHFLDDFFGKNSSGVFSWFQKPKKIMSNDSSVIIYKFFEDEIVENAKSLLENFNSAKESFKGTKMRSKYNWWTPVAHSKLKKIGGPEFCAWTSEYVPSYKLQINTDKLKDIKFEGWRRSADNRWEVLLTHSQMAGLAETLDMYYEDIYSLPDKELSCHSTTKFTNFSSKKVPASFFISSSDEQVISVLAEAVCVAALQHTEKHFLDDFFGKNSSGVFSWFQKPKKIMSNDSSVIIYKFFEDEIVENAKSLLENFNSAKESFKGTKMRSKYNWWTPVAHSKLKKIGGPEFCAWTSEYVPSYKLQINTDKLKDIKFEGWRRSADNRWEVLLTHSQMAGLAETLDMYYEDIYSLPDKELSCHSTTKFTNFSSKKVRSSLLKILSVGLATGIFLVAISALGHIFFPLLRKGEIYTQQLGSPPSSEIEYAINESLDNEKLQEFCVLVVKKIKDGCGWPGDVITEENNGAWIGEVPKYLKMMDKSDSNIEENSTSASSEKIDEDIKSAAQDIASYQVVLSTDGKIIGFQPTSRIGVNHWASNPLAKELYGGRKLSPGIFEPGHKIRLPKEIVVIELLMSANFDACFVLARPAR